MSDRLYASMLFAALGVALVIYGAILKRTGDKRLLPVRATHSVSSKEDVRRIGRYTVMVGLLVLALAALGAIAG